MKLSEQKQAAFESIVELLMNQWQELDRHLKSENQDSKARELNDTRNEVLMKLRELELLERMSQRELEDKEKMLEQKSLELDSQNRALVKMEAKLHSELRGIKRREAELHLGKKELANLEEGFEIKKMMFDLKTEGFAAASSSGSKHSKSEVKMEGNQRKRRKAASGDGLSFLLNIVKTHNRSYVTVPGSFVSAYDLSVKKYVILSTDKGDFRLEVRHFSSPKIIVHLRKGWKDFYTKNLLKVGSQCLFKLKENTVNGDASGFSMDVSVLDH